MVVFAAKNILVWLDVLMQAVYGCGEDNVLYRNVRSTLLRSHKIRDWNMLI